MSATRTARTGVPLGVLLGVVLLGGCAAGEPARLGAAGSSASPTPSSSPSTSAPAQATAPVETTAPAVEPAADPGPQPSDGSPADAVLGIEALGLRGLDVLAYEGHTDDRPGTDIQDRGDAASPHGPQGGVGPGGIGNYQVTAHRNTAGGPFHDLPALDRGDRVSVTSGGVVYTYRITTTRITSFRSEASLAEQRAAVPGRPGATPVRAMITLSTCRTQEDHAEGNYWSDELDNPEHRIDKIGVLVATRPA